MMDRPEASEIIDAVRAFLETTLLPELDGHTAFHARVAVNALAIVGRELAQGPAAAAAAQARLEALLGATGTLEDLTRMLSARLRARQIARDDPQLIAHLRATTIAKVGIDQPGYSGLKTALTPAGRGTGPTG